MSTHPDSSADLPESLAQVLPLLLEQALSDEELEKLLAATDAEPLTEQQVTRILSRVSDYRTAASGSVPLSRPTPHSPTLQEESMHAHARSSRREDHRRAGSFATLGVVVTSLMFVAVISTTQPPEDSPAKETPANTVAQNEQPVEQPGDTPAVVQTPVKLPGEIQPKDVPIQYVMNRVDGNGLTPRELEAAPAPKPLTLGKTLTTAQGQKRRVGLPDGSVLFVNEQTEVTLTAARKLKLTKGEIFLEVSPRDEESDRFQVETADNTFTALGTKFSVRTDAAKTSMLVAQGKVRVDELKQPLTTGQEITVKPGDDQRYHIESAPRISYALRWTRELVEAARTPLIPANQNAGGSLIAKTEDGKDVRFSLRKYHIDVFIHDGFARTTIDQTYFNHTHSRLEGTFRFPLPADSSLSRLAMYVADTLMEGGMVERNRGRNVFESIVHKMQDPALLEWVDGSTFKMRVFPLEPRQEKRILISYTQKLPTSYRDMQYRFPAGHSLGTVGKWSMKVEVEKGTDLDWKSTSHEFTADTKDGNLVLTAQEDNSTMSHDVVLEWSAKAKPIATPVEFATATLDAQRYLMVRYRPEFKTNVTREPRNWVFLFESSANRNPVLARTQIEVIKSMLNEAEHFDSFSLLAANTHVDLFKKEPVRCTPENIAAAISFLEKTHLVGALDLEQALAAANIFTKNKPHSYLVHVGGAKAVLGERRENQLTAMVPKDVKYVGIGVGKQWAREFMKATASRTGGYVTQINPDEEIAWEAKEVSAILNTPRLLDVRIFDQAEQTQFLAMGDAVAHGEELCAIAKLTKDQAFPETVTVTGQLNGKTYEQILNIEDVKKEAGYLPRIWARLEIDRLLAEGRQENQGTIITLSKAMYVMSPFTSLLVLENEAMYQQYKVDRGRKDHWAMYPAPAKIPVVTEPVKQKPVQTKNEKPKKPSVAKVLNTVLVKLPTPLLGDADAKPIPIKAMTAWQIAGGAPLATTPNGRFAGNVWWNRNVNQWNYWGVQPQFTNGRVTHWEDYGISVSNVPLGWRSVELDWNDGAWEFDFSRPHTTFRGFDGNVGPFYPYMNRPGPMINGPGPGPMYYPNSAAIAYPSYYSASAWPYLGTSTVYPVGDRVLNVNEIPHLLGGRTYYENLWAKGYADPTRRIYSEFLTEQNRYRILLNDLNNDELTKRMLGVNQRSREIYLDDRLRSHTVVTNLGRYEIPYTLAQGIPREGFSVDDLTFELRLPEQEREFAERIALVRQNQLTLPGLRGGDQQLAELPASVLRKLKWSHPGLSRMQSLVQQKELKPLLQYKRPVWQNNPAVFRDLTAYAPGFQVTDADLQAILEAEADVELPPTGKIDPAARKLIETARGRGWVKVTLPETHSNVLREVLIDGSGRLRAKFTHATGIQETIISDGNTQWQLYPEIGLGTVRTVSRHHRSTLNSLVPWLLPPVEELAVGAHVKLIDQHTVAIVPIQPEVEQKDAEKKYAKPVSTLELRLTFSEDGRLMERKLMVMPEAKQLVRATYAADGLIKVYNSKDELKAQHFYKTELAGAPNLKPDEKSLVIVPMPLRINDTMHLNLQAAARSQGENMSEVDAIRLLAIEAAVGRAHPARNLFGQRFLKRNDHRLGFYVLLLAAGEQWTINQTYNVAGFRYKIDPTEKHPNSPLAQYILHQMKNGAGGKSLVLADDAPQFLADLSTFQNLMATWDRVKSEKRNVELASPEISATFKYLKHCKIPAFKLALGHQLTGYLNGPKYMDLARIYEEIPESSRWWYVSRYEQVRMLQLGNSRRPAGDAMSSLYLKALRLGYVPPVDPLMVQTLQGKGEKWSVFSYRVLDILLKQKRYHAAVQFALTSHELGQTAEAERVLELTLQASPPEMSLSLLLTVMEYYWRTSQPARAESLMAGMLKQERFAKSPQMWRLGSTIANQRGLLSVSLTRLEKAVDLEYGSEAEDVTAEEMKTAYAELLSKYAQLGDALQKLEPKASQALVRRVIRTADRWRMLGVDTDTACNVAAKVLKDLGEPNLAWSYLTTPLADTAHESGSWVNLGNRLKTEGEIALASQAFDQAYEMEPTNPRILFNHATMLKENGQLNDARSLYQQIAEGEWQSRFNNLKSQAETQLEGDDK